MNPQLAETPQAATHTTPRSARAFTVEFWRFVFTVLVCLYHFEMFFGTPKILGSGESAVEFFFVLAGFLIAKSARRDLAGRVTPVSVREAHAKALDFVKKKLKAIYPVLILVLILGIFVYPAYPAPLSDRLKVLQNSEWELLLLVGTPFGFNNGMAPIVPMWFLTGLITVGYLYTFAIYKNYDLVAFAAPVVGVLFYIYFTLNSTLILDFNVKMGFFTAGMVRAFSEMALGISMFYLYDYLSKKRLGLSWRIVLSLLEVYAVYRFFALTLWQPLGMDNFRRLVYILIIVLLSFLNVTALSGLLNKRIWSRLASLSLAMYLSHFGLVNVYMNLLNALKASLWRQSLYLPAAGKMLNFLQDTGGFDAFKFAPLPMSLKDMIPFILLVMAVSSLIMLYIAFVKKYCVKPGLELYREIQAEKAAVSRDANTY